MKRFLRKLIGHKWDNRFTWGEFYFTPRPKDWSLQARVTGRGEDIRDMFVLHLFLFKLYLYIPTKFCACSNYCDSISYGFYLYDRVFNWTTTVFQWGKKSKSINTPWSYKWHSTEVLDWNFNTIWKEDTKNKKPFLETYDEVKRLEKENGKEFDFEYITNRGIVQDRKVFCYIGRQTWKMRWFPFIKNSQTCLNYEFNQETGEKVGSWKGGVISSGIVIKKGQTPERALENLRMQIF